LRRKEKGVREKRYIEYNLKMDRQYRILLGLLFITKGIIITGVLFKILHWVGANTVLISGFIPEAILVGYIVFLVFSDNALGKFKILWRLLILMASSITSFFYLFHKIKQTQTNKFA
jgi:hypothetical protein